MPPLLNGRKGRFPLRQSAVCYGLWSAANGGEGAAARGSGTRVTHVGYSPAAERTVEASGPPRRRLVLEAFREIVDRLHDTQKRWRRKCLGLTGRPMGEEIADNRHGVQSQTLDLRLMLATARCFRSSGGFRLGCKFRPR